ncbi:MAG: RnfABCDGE type electron transport complex subunit D [Chloroflexi bacterium]|nr:RnfABCDGE type electron transport complex subunit D [Chloroflexota bacterium]
MLTANNSDWQSTTRRGDDAPKLPLFLRTPKGQLLCIFGLLLLIAAPFDGGLAVLPHVLVAVLAACVLDVLLGYWYTHRWITPTSALLSGLIVAFILGAQEPWLVVAWVAAFASISKRVFATQREHIFNPAALALLGSALFFSSGQSWWGALGDAPGVFALVLVACGVFIVDRLNKFGLVLAFLATYFAAFAAVSLLNAASVTEMFRTPFVQSALFLAFFMLTDPPTSPNRLVDQVWYGVIAGVVAVVCQLLGAGQVYLLLGVLAANVWLAVRRWMQRRPRLTTPLEGHPARQVPRVAPYPLSSHTKIRKAARALVLGLFSA